MLDAPLEFVLALIKRIDLLEHFLAGVLKILFHFFEVFALYLVKLRVFCIDNTIKAFNDVVGLLLIGLVFFGGSDVTGKFLELAVLQGLEKCPGLGVWVLRQYGRIYQHVVSRLHLVHLL